MPKNFAASINHRLKRLADERGEDFQLILTRYGIERLLYRLSLSRYSDAFVLKGATLIYLWEGSEYRPTRDLDLLGLTQSNLEELQSIFREICDIRIEEDGLVFDQSSVRGEDIRENQDYHGARIRFQALLGSARISIQIDIGFGDKVIPEPEIVSFPSILDFPKCKLKAYTRESVIAEKCQAMITLGIGSSRMNDFYDIWQMAEHFSFDGPLLKEAIETTFSRRSTEPPDAIPPVLSAEYYGKPEVIRLWSSFLHRIGEDDSSTELGDVIQTISAFLMPVLFALASGQEFHKNWEPGGLWK